MDSEHDAYTDAMLSVDTAAQKMLEECLVRMPNQNLSVQEAREVLELMRSITKQWRTVVPTRVNVNRWRGFC
ncbi:MAG: hypothetical protein IPI07_18420 [Flavobacteriales bacterium]|nr:hypothetical protein [Flavobacteriales bacterium]